MRLLQFTLPFIQEQFAVFGVLGCVLICLSVLISALAYRGAQQERYSLLNHFVSELGEKGVSVRARIFNVGLIVSGLLMLPFILGLGARLPSIWGTLGTAAGVVTALACAAVGLFPMNHLPSHIAAAMTFFRAGLVMIVLFSVAILVQPDGQIQVARSALIFSALASVSYISFLVMVRGGSALDRVGEPAPAETRPPRPRFYALSLVEWGIFFSTVFWLLAVALMVA
jgi:hypothetical membrane protein